MRSDMGKCVTERPRRGSRGASSAKARWYGKIIESEFDGLDYDGLTRLPSSPRQNRYFPKLGDKDFSDVLGPIDNYLRASCGRPWNDVFSEMSRTLGRGAWPVRHVLIDHVRVATNTFVGRDGKIHVHDKYGEHELTKYVWRREFYVDPRTGILREGEKPARWRNGVAGKPKADECVQDGDRWFVRIKGLWYIGAYRDVKQYPVEWVAPGERRSDDGDRTIIYTGRQGALHYPAPEWPDRPAGGRRAGTLVFVKIKQASKRELRRLGELRGGVMVGELGFEPRERRV